MRFGRRCLAAVAAAAAGARASHHFRAPLLSLVPLAPFLAPLAPTRSLSPLLLLPVRSVSLYPTERPRFSISFPPLVSYCSCLVPLDLCLCLAFSRQLFVVPLL